MPKIIFVTMLPLWSMKKGYGGPAFTQTVEKYINQGWEVFLLSDEPSNAEYPNLDKAHNRVLKASIFKRFELLRKIGWFFRWADYRWMTYRFYQEGKRLAESAEKETVFYAYELFGVEACRRLSCRIGGHLVTRFQGTKLVALQNTLLNHIRRYPCYQAISQRAELVIMTDDGTQGDRILQELHNTSPTLFFRNGLELLERDIPAMQSAFNRVDFRAKLGILENETMFLSVSRLTSWKKVERTLDGFAKGLQSAPHSKLVVVGDGDTRRTLEEHAAALGIANRVLFTGAVPHEQVYDYMMACDVFVSMYDLSNVGNPLLEAMTLGKCIVTLDVGDTKKLIANRKNGILLTYDMLPTLGDIFGELACMPELRTSLGDAAADYAKKNFWTWEARMDAEFQAVNALLKKD